MPTTLDEALAELGLDARATAEDARRAYLRLLKTRKPEVDPEGFQRLRAAYELAKAALPASFVRAQAEAVVATASAPPPTVAESDGEPADDTEEDEDTDAEDEEPTRTLREFFQRAARDGTGFEPLVPAAIAEMFFLHERGEAEEAKALRRAVARCIRIAQNEARVLRPPLGDMWRFARALDELPVDFPLEARAAIARAVRTLDLAGGRAALQAFWGRDPVAAETAAEMIGTTSVLASEFGAALVGEHAPRKVGWAGLSGAMSIVLVALIAFVRALSSGDDAPEKSPAAALARYRHDAAELTDALDARDCKLARKRMYALRLTVNAERAHLERESFAELEAKTDDFSTKTAKLCADLGEAPP